ncbi:MAG: T9SS type A sorting domain-containing protein [Flavitalea sp.]
MLQWEFTLCCPECSRCVYKKGAYLGNCEAVQSKTAPVKAREKIFLNSNTIFAYPNPSGSNIAFRFKTDTDGPANLYLYDMNGKLVAQLFNGILKKGTLKQIDFSCQTLSPGTYISVLKTISGNQQQKIIVTR